MGYSIIPFILVIIPLGIIIFVVIRKFPQITLLDVDSLPEVKEEKKKDEVHRRIAEEHAAKTKRDLSKKLRPILNGLKNLQLSFRKYVGNVQRRTVKENIDTENIVEVVSEEKSKTSKSLMREANNARSQEDLESAEKKYLSAIRQDPKNSDAYRGLADIYMEQENIAEAKETYEFILTLDKTDHITMVKLAGIAEKEGQLDKAVGYYEQALLLGDHDPVRFAKLASLLQSMKQYDTAYAAIEQAVELEPANIEYLDMLTEISIMSENKDRAEEAMNKLRMASPEHKHLVSFKERIGKL